MLVLDINLRDQKAYIRRDSTVLGDYAISSSKFGVGFEKGSFKTPVGKFKVFEKIGEGEPMNTIFQMRKPKGVWDKTKNENDLILTRIIWIEGLDLENSSTKDRHIYFHGTNHEDLIGVPSSSGCIRFKNEDIIHLFNLIEADTEIIIRG